MKRKLFTFLVAFLATLSGAVWAQNYDYEVNLTEHEANNDAAYVVTENGSYRFYGTHNHGIQISRNISPTITLDGVTITVRGTAIEVNGDADPIIVLLGENVINSEGTDEAISVARDNNTSITFSENSTGSLTINMEDTESHYAIGEDGTCGDVIIKGGTIITEGKIGKLVDKNADIEQNAILICGGFDESWHPVDSHINRNGGIIFENSTTGIIYGEPILKSPLPEPYKIDLESGKEFTVGEGETLDESQINFKGGILNAYKVTYNLNQKVGSNEVSIANADDYGVKYCGKNTPLLTGPEATNSNVPTWHNFGWSDTNHSFITTTPTDKDPGSIENSENQIAVTAVWVVNTWTTVQVNTGEKLSGEIQLVYPEEVSLSFTESTTGTLDTYGAKIIGTKIVPGDNGAGEANVEPENVILNIGDSDKTVTVPFKVNNDAPDLSDEKVTVVTVTEKIEYTGNPVDENTLITSVKVNNVEVGVSPFEVKYSSDAEGKNSIEAPTDKGNYYVYIAPKAGNANYQKQSKPKAFEITPKSITATAEDFKIKVGETPDFTQAKISFAKEGGLVDGDKVEVDATTITGTTSVSVYDLPGTYSVNYSFTALKGDDAANYTCTTATGNLIVSLSGLETDPIDEEDGIQIGDEGWKNGARTYDGYYHNLETVLVKYAKADGTEGVATVSLGKDAVTYLYQTAEGEEAEEVDNVKNAGIYTAQFTFPEGNEYGYDGAGELTLVIERAPLTVKVSTQPYVSVGDDVTSMTFAAQDYLSVDGEVAEEEAMLTGNLEIKEGVTISTEKEIEYLDVFSTQNQVKIVPAEGNEFDVENYTVAWPEKIGLLVGPITLNPDEEGVIGGEDTNNDGNLDENDFILITSDDTKLANSVYDGQSHELAKLEIGDRMLTEGTDYEVSYKSEDEPSVDEEGLPLHAADYTITVTLKGAYQFADNTTEKVFNAAIAQRSMTITFVKEVSSLDELKDINKLVQCDGIVKGEWPEISAAITAKAIGNNRYSVSITSISISNSNSFYLSDYNVSIDKNGDGVGDEEITDEDGDGSGVWEGDDDDTIDIEITVNPGKDDDDDTPDHGHGGSDINRPAKYYNIYVDTAATSDGVELSLSKDVVKEGNQVSVYIDKILEGYNAENMKVQIKRSLYGYWEEIEEGVQPGEYIIYNIYTDIYVKVTDVEKEDATGIDDLEGIKAYTKDGSIYVYTPNREEVIIISMSGAIIKNEEQVGLQSYSVSRGIYIVRIDDKVFKLKN